MAEITVRRTGEHLRKLFAILKASPDGIRAGAALEALASQTQLTDHEAGNYESTGSRRFEKIIRFATVDCAKAGWLLKHKGTWTLTPDGLAAFEKFSDPEAFYREAIRLYRTWRAAQPTESAEASSDTTEPVGEKAVSINFEQADEQAWNEITHYVAHMPWQEFQELVADLLRAMGYHVSWIAPPGKDGGVDIIAHPDALGTQSPRIKVQVKRWQAASNADAVRAFCALINDDDVGIFVTAGSFTRDALDFARNQERRKLTLIDLERLFDLWVEHFPRLSELARRRLPITPIYFLTPQ